MTFAHPQLLSLLLVFPPALIAFFWWSGRKRRELMAQFIQSRLLPGLISGVSPARERLRNAFLVLSTVFIILALARPQWGFEWEEVKQRGLDIVVAVDTSKSMLAQDIAPNRLERAKLAALELMQLAKSDRLGVVAFAGSAFLVCPLTIDDTAFAQSVNSLDVKTISQGGTALADAIETAQTAFKEGDNHRILVLMTDGEDHDSGALEAAKKAAQAGLQIFTIGIGTPEGELLRVQGPNGQTDYVRDEQGNVVKSHLNETLLQQIAGTSDKGFYLPLRGAKTMETLFDKGLAPLPKSDSSQKLVKRLKERYYWPLALGILFLLAEMLLPERKRESRRRKETPTAKPAVAITAFILALLSLAARVDASPSSALRDYKAGDYDQAYKEYQQLLERKKDDPRLFFNGGAAAYRDKKFDEAARMFTNALRSTDIKLQQQCYYNLGNSLYWLGERVSDPQKKTQTWEQSAKGFESSLKLDPQDPDAKFNLEFVKKRLEELKQQQSQKNNQPQDIKPSEDAKRAKALADDAVHRREYARALEIMETQLQKDQTTAYYNDYIQRLREINGVQTSPSH